MDAFFEDLKATRLGPSMGLDIDHFSVVGGRRPDDLHDYWKNRKHDRIYVMTLVLAQLFCRRKRTVADVGCFVSPLLLMLPSFEKRFAIDPMDEAAHAWRNVESAEFINGMLEDVDIRQKTGGDDLFDLIVCNQVIEHLDDPEQFAAMLLSRCRRLIISTTYQVPEGCIRGHAQDPISIEKFESWFSRKMICSFINGGPVGGKILAVF